MQPFTTLVDSTLLVLVNQPLISAETISKLGQFTNMVIVGNYAPTGLNYGSLVKLETLRMYDGEMTASLRTSVQNLVKNTKKLKYIEIIKWGSNTIEENAFALDYTNKDKSIQELVGFEDVTTVGYRAFYYCANLKSVSLPNVTTLAEQVVNSVYSSDAFYNCTGLKSVSLPLLESVGGCAFDFCTGLTTLSLPLLETAGEGAFSYCSGLTSVSMPLLESAGHFAFSGCSGLMSLSLPVLETACEGAFYSCSGLKTLSLPLLNTAGECAFYYCSGLKSLSLPLLESAGERAFADSGLMSLSLPLLQTAGNDAFRYCTGLTSLSLPLLTEAGEQAFGDCSALKDVTLSDKLLSVASDAFKNTNPTTLRLVGHETSGNDIIESCKKLDSTNNLQGKIIDFYYILGEELQGYSSLGTYINNVRNINRSDFTLFANSTTGSGILDLGHVCDSFAYTVSANKLISYIPPVLYYRGKVENTELTTLQTAEDLTVVGNYTTTGLTVANYGTFTKLKSLRLFEGNMTTELFTAIRNLAYNTRVLTRLEISNCSTIPELAFSGCSSLHEFVGEDVTSTDLGAFNGCSGLTSVILPELTYAGGTTFKGCSSLTSLILPKLITVERDMVPSCTALTTIILPELTNAGQYAFRNCTALTTLHLPKLTDAGQEAFRNCNALTTLVLPELITAGYQAFFDCKALTTLYLPKLTRANVGANAFGYVPTAAIPEHLK
jgi:hypothetical protein